MSEGEKQWESKNADPERPNWDAIFTQTFLLSQGNPQVQHRIFIALALGPLRGMVPTKEELARYDKAAQYGAVLGRRGAHTKAGVADKPELTDAELEAQVRSMDMRQVFENPRTESLSGDEEENAFLWYRELLWSFVGQDHTYLSKFTGRPVKGAVRDKWSSFIVDFCILKHGTPPWSYESLAGPVQEMCEVLGEMLEAGVLEDSKTKSKLKKVLGIYLSKHPQLREEDRARLKALRETL